MTFRVEVDGVVVPDIVTAGNVIPLRGRDD